jgi:hypothetical protein
MYGVRSRAAEVVCVLGMPHFAVVLVWYLPHTLPFLSNSGQTKNEFGLEPWRNAAPAASVQRLLPRLLRACRYVSLMKSLFAFALFTASGIDRIPGH